MPAHRGMLQNLPTVYSITNRVAVPMRGVREFVNMYPVGGKKVSRMVRPTMLACGEPVVLNGSR